MRILLPAGLLAFVLAFGVLHAVAAPGAAPENPVPAAPAAAAPAPAPSPPAFSTCAVSRIHGIEGDAFSFECDDRRVITIRLAEADCRALGGAAVESAKSVAATLLQSGAVWVFPCGQATGAAGEEVWADVWTPKGWLSDILIRAGYAKRRAEADAAALTPLDKPCASSQGAPPPAAPAFAAATCSSNEGDTLEVEHRGRKLKVYLADVTCQGLDSAKRDAATATVARLLQAGPFWVFPCPSAKGQGPDDVQGRVWTQRGWLSTALLQEGSARRLAEGERPAGPPGATASAKTGPAAGPKPAAGQEPPKPGAEPTKHGAEQVQWQEIPLKTAGALAMSCQSSRFRIEVPQWRITWNLKPWRTGSPVSLSVCRVDDNVASGETSTHLGSFKGLSGSAAIRARPGTFWIQVTGSGRLDVKVEVPG
jgi:hypothetical protein